MYTHTIRSIITHKAIIIIYQRKEGQPNNNNTSTQGFTFNNNS